MAAARDAAVLDRSVGAGPPAAGVYGDADHRWWEYAVGVFCDLATGRPVPILPVRSPAGEPAHLDAWFDCASWCAAHVVPGQRGGVFAGPPLTVAVAMAATAVANQRERCRAADASRPQWRQHGSVRVLVDADATWIGRGSDWRRFAHTTVRRVEISGQASVVTYGEVPVRLAGPAVWCHAVLTAFWGPGPGRWVHAAYLAPVQRVALLRAGAG
jgi:hypothetical protein